MKGSEFKELIASLDTMTPAQTAKFREALKAEAERRGEALPFSVEKSSVAKAKPGKTGKLPT
jgi:hypothetical protein